MSGKINHQGRNAKVICELGEIKSCHEFALNVPQAADLSNGVMIGKAVNVTGTLKARGRFMAAMLVKAGLNGKLQPPVKFEFMILHVAEDNQTVPLTAVLENVWVSVPESLTFNRIEGSDSIFDFPFSVAGKALVNGMLVNPDPEEGGI